MDSDRHTNKVSKEAATAKKTLVQFAKKMDKHLAVYLKKETQAAFGVNSDQKQLVHTLLDHTAEHDLRPAKRARGVFIYFGHKLFDSVRGYKNLPEKDIFHAAMSIELVHTGLLMIDDKMDQDDTRRGLPTTHKFFEKYHKDNLNQGDPEFYGDNMAVNLGVTSVSLGYRILAETKADPATVNKALITMFDGIIKTTYGQAYDLTLEALGVGSESDIAALHHAKTGIYTYELPIQVGAMLAGAKSADLKLISKYAIPGGIAFQFQDDILGLFGNPQKTGKPAHSDLRQGKTTLLIAKALELGNKEQIKRLRTLWGKENITDAEADEARKIVVDTGSLDYSKNVSINYALKAQKATHEMRKRGWNKEAVDYLYGIAKYMAERDL